MITFTSYSSTSLPSHRKTIVKTADKETKLIFGSDKTDSYTASTSTKRKREEEQNPPQQDAKLKVPRSTVFKTGSYERLRPGQESYSNKK